MQNMHLGGPSNNTLQHQTINIILLNTLVDFYSFGPISLNRISLKTFVSKYYVNKRLENGF